ncbi:MAG: gliding motility-associated C-terminal domain-containing protein [Saprospiraceae bacterium]
MKNAAILLAVLSPLFLRAQFQLNGVAVQSAGSCYTLTPDALNSAGSIWSPLKINLDESFQAIFKLHLGCKDDSGADGIVFGFQPVSTSVGQAGGGLGFQDISPSLGIEFDTWENWHLGDPAFDHIAISRDGNLDHGNTFSNLAGPVQAHPASANIEDCTLHRVRVDWDAGQQLLRIWFDCSLRLSWSGDMVSDIFNGDPWVYWGFTASTGAASNLQQVCLDYTTFYQQQPDVRICAGGKAQLAVSGAQSYLWSPPEGLSATGIPNPVASPEQTTTYVVEMRDECEFPFYDTVLVFVHEDSLLVELGPDTTFCEGSPHILDATPLNPAPDPFYAWQNGEVTPQISAGESGTYRVTVSLGADCITQDWVRLTRIDLPVIRLGQDTLACREEPLLLTPEALNAGQFLWNTGAATPELEVERPGAYVLEVFNECGADSDTVRVDFRHCESELFVPNIFTPNADGINDRVGVMGPEGIGVVRLFQIFDRWGNLVYEAQNIPVAPNPTGWDGATGGKPLPAGVYAYWAEIVFLNGEKKLIKGPIQLLR